MKRMEEWISGLFYKQEDYNVELFHKIPGVQEPNIIGTVNLKKNEYQKIDDARTTVGKYFKNTHVCENQEILLTNLKKHLYKLKIQLEKKKTRNVELIAQYRTSVSGIIPSSNGKVNSESDFNENSMEKLT